MEDGQPRVYFRTFEGVNINDMVRFFPLSLPVSLSRWLAGSLARWRLSRHVLL